MANGLLKVSGTIDLSQFWPKGSSDADTTKILINVGVNAFSFRPHSKAPFQTTHAFDDAIVIGQIRKKAIDKNNRITVRLQGIDAPELHYRPLSHLKDSNGRTKAHKEKYLEVNEEYRQFLAETATVKLVKFLAKNGHDPLPCTVETAVDEPDEVFDTYGRFVGDIVVKVGKKLHNVNHWLVIQGFAYPAFYNSMSEEEITTLSKAAKRARRGKLYIWSNFADNVGRLDWQLIYRRPSSKPVYVESDDIGDTIFPKLFRRLATWEVNRYAGMVTSSFWSYLESKNDGCYLTEEFLSEPTVTQLYGLHNFLHLDGYFEKLPYDLVFREKSSRLIKPGGGSVTW